MDFQDFVRICICFYVRMGPKSTPIERKFRELIPIANWNADAAESEQSNTKV